MNLQDISNPCRTQSPRQGPRDATIRQRSPSPRMLRTLRRSSLSPSLRRLIAVLLGLCVSVAFAEPMTADRCEDVVPQLMVGTSAGEGFPQAVLMGVDSKSQPDRSQIPDGHALHLCHCAHAHGGTLTTRHTIPDRIQTVAVAVASHSDRIPPSAIGDPQLRPPRALIA